MSGQSRHRELGRRLESGHCSVERQALAPSSTALELRRVSLLETESSRAAAEVNKVNTTVRGELWA